MHRVAVLEVPLEHPLPDDVGRAAHRLRAGPEHAMRGVRPVRRERFREDRILRLRGDEPLDVPRLGLGLRGHEERGADPDRRGPGGERQTGRAAAHHHHVAEALAHGRGPRASASAERAAAQVLETRLRKVLREKLGETYDVGVRSTASKVPREEYRVVIDLGADPKRIDSLSKVIFKEIRKLQDKGPAAAEVSDVRTAESRVHETNIRENDWWLDEITQRYWLGEDPAEALRFPETLARLLTGRLTPVSSSAR